MKISSPLLSSPLLSSPSPYASQTKVGSNTNANHARSGQLLVNGKGYIKENGQKVLVTVEKFLPMVQDAFHPVLNEEGKGLLPKLVDTFANHETEHLNFTPKDPDNYFNKATGQYHFDPFGSQADFLRHTTNKGENRILSSPYSITSREDLTQAPQTQSVKTLLAWLDKYKQRGHEEFPVVAQELIDGKPASIRR
jgi:hypothetical protein